MTDDIDLAQLKTNVQDEEIDYRCECAGPSKKGNIRKCNTTTTYNLDNNPYMVLSFKIFDSEGNKLNKRITNFNEDSMQIFGNNQGYFLNFL